MSHYDKKKQRFLCVCEVNVLRTHRSKLFCEQILFDNAIDPVEYLYFDFKIGIMYQLHGFEEENDDRLDNKIVLHSISTMCYTLKRNNDSCGDAIIVKVKFQLIDFVE